MHLWSMVTTNCHFSGKSHPTLPNNREMVLKLLNHLKRSLDNDKDLYEMYDEKIKEHQRK